MRADDAQRVSLPVGALVGGGLGFLWYNTPPAHVFMGDTGSLALGGCLGAMAVCVKHEIVLAIVGGLFLLEALSVIIQVLYFKATGKRFFKMAPVHHHFEKLGWSEPTVVIRFWIIAFLLALAGASNVGSAATLLGNPQNLLIGHHIHRGAGFWSNLFFTRATRDAELAALRTPGSAPRPSRAARRRSGRAR